MWLLALLLPAHACETATRTSDVVDAAGRAEVAYTSMDVAAFEAAVAEAREDLGCLGEPITPDGAATYHRAEALAAFLAGQEISAKGHFAAVRAIQPGWRLSTAIAPDGHPLRAVYDEAVPTDDRFPFVLPPSAAWCAVDGVRSGELPSDRPFVLQCFGADGGVLSTEEGRASDILVASEPQPEPLPVAPMPEPAAEGDRKKKKGRLAISAGALALGSGAAFLVAGLSHEQYWDPATAPGKLPGLNVATNVSTVTGAALGAAALGCATGAVLVGRF